MIQKILFLDIDGVLTDSSCSYYTDNYSLNMEKVEKIRGLLERTGARIVWSTNWRFHADGVWISDGKTIHSPYLKACALFADFILDSAPHERGNAKSTDIRNWLDAHFHLWDDFVIVDDQDNQGLAEFGERFFKTDFDTGVTDSVIEGMERILSDRHHHVLADCV